MTFKSNENSINSSDNVPKGFSIEAYVLYDASSQHSAIPHRYIIFRMSKCGAQRSSQQQRRQRVSIRTTDNGLPIGITGDVTHPFVLSRAILSFSLIVHLSPCCLPFICLQALSVLYSGAQRCVYYAVGSTGTQSQNHIEARVCISNHIII